MFNFGKQNYVQLHTSREGGGRPHANGPQLGRAGSGSVSGSGVLGSIDIEMDSAGSSRAPSSHSGGATIGGDSGRVQVPIGMVSDSALMRQWQVLALVAFALAHVAIFILLCVLGLSLSGWARVVIVALGGGGWLALLLFNLRLAGRPRKVIQSFLNLKPKARLTPRPRKGSIVVVKGAVSLLHEELLSTEFHNVPGLVLVESSLRSYHPGVKKTEAWTEHVRQTRAVDFRITDSSSGATAIVRAFSASESGAATPLVHISTEVPLSTAVPVSPPNATSDQPTIPGGTPGPKPVDTDERRRRKAKAAAAPQLMVCKGYIRQGQVITVMGEVTEVEGTPELYISALSHPHNISKFLLYRNFIPFFFPTWVSGLVISDQRDMA